MAADENENNDQKLGLDREVLYAEELTPPFAYEVVVSWRAGQPAPSEIRAVRSLWHPFANMGLAEFRRLAAASAMLVLPRRFGRLDAMKLVEVGRSRGLHIVSRPIDGGDPVPGPDC